MSKGEVKGDIRDAVEDLYGTKVYKDSVYSEGCNQERKNGGMNE